MTGLTFTKVGCVLSAAHRNTAGQVHGHTWLVWATWPDTGADALDLQRDLRAVVAQYDHSFLPDELSIGEALARAIAGQLPGVVRIDVDRSAEMITGFWEAAR